jgi:nucleotide-binding universal stress UspA family protein
MGRFSGGRELSMKTILVAYDDTEPSRRALDRAATLAEAFGSRVLVTSIAPLHYSTPRLTLTVKERGEGLAAREEDMRQAQALLEERGIAADALVARGDPASAIARLAEEHDVDLVVVGTRELGALQRLLGQSVSQAVSRRVRCDLLIVHPGE